LIHSLALALSLAHNDHAVKFQNQSFLWPLQHGLDLFAGADISALMKQDLNPSSLSRREYEVLAIIVNKVQASAREVEEGLEEAPSYSAVRSVLRILCEKKVIEKHRVKGRDFFSTVAPAKDLRKNALSTMVSRFFNNSVSEAACALLGPGKVKLTQEEADRLTALINERRAR